MTSTYVYRLIRSTWGIWISITADAQPLDHRRPAPAEVGPVALRFAGSAGSLPDHLRDQVEKGLSMITDELVEALGSARVLVTVEEIKYPETDFQDEGLMVAMIRWAEQELSLPPRPIIEEYSRAENRYRFTFPDGTQT